MMAEPENAATTGVMQLCTEAFAGLLDGVIEPVELAAGHAIGRQQIDDIAERTHEQAALEEEARSFGPISAR